MRGGEVEVLGFFYCLWRGMSTSSTIKADRREKHVVEMYAYFSPSCRRVQAQSPQVSPLPMPSVGPLKDPSCCGLFVMQLQVILRVLCRLVLLEDLAFLLVLNLGN